MMLVWLSVLFISGFVRRFNWAPIQLYFNMAMHAFTTAIMVLISARSLIRRSSRATIS